MQKTDTSEIGIHKSERQHLDAVLHFSHVFKNSTKLTKAETSSESGLSAILKSLCFSVSEISLNEGLYRGFVGSPDSMNTEINIGTNLEISKRSHALIGSFTSPSDVLVLPGLGNRL
jgi:hypothetical protein